MSKNSYGLITTLVMGMSWLLRPDSIYVWENEEVRRRLSWYYMVMKKLRPPRYVVASQIKVEFRKDWDYDELWRIHNEKSKEFDELFSAIRMGEKINIKKVTPNFLDLKYVIALKTLEKCSFCEWRCGVNRLSKLRGVCRLASSAGIASYFLHWGEEAPLVPSGTVFFASCNSRCVFCQNWDISTDPSSGFIAGEEELAGIFLDLEDRGARNINLVGGEPTPNIHVILGALRLARLRIPILWNSNMYLTEESMKLLREVIDIWLPDFKFGNNRCASRLSSLPRYFEVVSRNHMLISKWGADVIVRHLVLPGHVECCTKPILRWLSRNMPKALVNIMDQYRPEHLVLRRSEKYREIARRPRGDEIWEAYRYAEELGIVYKPVS